MPPPVFLYHNRRHAFSHVFPSRKNIMANRRGKGEGSISQRADGLWVARIDMGHNANGKRLRKVVYGKTKTACAKKLTRLQSQKLDGTYVESGNLTVAELLDKWIDSSSCQKLSGNTLARYRGVMVKHIKPRIGALKLAKLKPMDIVNLIDQMTTDEVGARTQGHVFAVCRRAFNVAVKWELLVRNPCGAVTAPQYTRGDIVPLTLEQAVATLKASETTDYHALFVLAIMSGLRQGELFALQLSDIDLDKGELTVSKSLEEVKGKLTIKDPKSKSGRRKVALPEVAISAMVDHKAKLMAKGLLGCGIAFPSPEGTYMRKSNFTRRVWFGVRKAAGLPKSMTFHGLRHSAATLLLSEGVSIKVIQEMMGHARMQTTSDNYLHLLPNMQQQSATTFNKLFPVKSA